MFDKVNSNDIGNDGFPAEILEKKLLNELKCISGSYCAPLGYVFICLLVFCGSLIGGNHVVQVKEGYFIYNNLYVGIVGGSGSGKTPVLAFFMKIFGALEQEIKKFKGKNNEELFHISFTYEALVKALEINPQGLLLVRDELANVFFEAGRYNKNGNETLKVFLNECYSGGRYKSSVLSRGLTCIERVLLSIIGGLTPSLLRGVFSNMDSESGFLQRFNFYYLPDRLKFFSEDAISTEHEATLMNLLSDLYENRTEARVVLRVSQDALELWRQWERDVEWLRYNNAYGYEELSGYLSKHKELPFKVASILFHVYQAMRASEKTEIDKSLMEVAIKISDFMSNQSIKVWEIFLDKNCKLTRDNLDANLLVTLEILIKDDKRYYFQATEIKDALNRYVKTKYGEKAVEYSAQAVGKSLNKLGFHHKRTSAGVMYAVYAALINELKGNV